MQHVNTSCSAPIRLLLLQTELPLLLVYQIITIDRCRAAEDFRVQRRGVGRCWKRLQADNREWKRIKLFKLLDRFLFGRVIGRLR